MNSLSLKRLGEHRLGALMVRDFRESYFFRKPFRILRNALDVRGKVTHLRHALRFGHIWAQNRRYFVSRTSCLACYFLCDFRNTYELRVTEPYLHRRWSRPGRACA